MTQNTTVRAKARCTSQDDVKESLSSELRAVTFVRPKVIDLLENSWSGCKRDNRSSEFAAQVGDCISSIETILGELLSSIFTGDICAVISP